MKNFFLALIAVVLMMGTTPVAAQTATTTGNLSDLLSQISSLSAMIRELEGKISDLRKQEKDVREEVRDVRKEFRAQLREGLSSDEVKDLQELLAQHPDIYPEKLVTGFFGPKTRQAVERFQRKHGIETIGIVGPQTRAKLNALIATGEFKVIPGGKKLGVDMLITTATTTGTGATTTPGMGKVTICHKEGKRGRHTIHVAVPAVSAHLNHGDSIGACKNEDHDDHDNDEDDDSGTTTPDTTAPVISDIAATTTSSGAMITWTTNEPAKGTVRYATTTPVSTATNQLVAMDSSLVTSHNLSLMSVTASTTYYFFVESQDSAGNTATSSEMLFMTL